MRFLLDASLPRAAVAVFRPYGETAHAGDLSLGNATDTAIFETALAQNAILVTRDLEFGNPHLFALDRVPGLVILRVPRSSRPHRSRRRLPAPFQSDRLSGCWVT